MAEGVITYNGVATPAAPATNQLKTYKPTGSDSLRVIANGGATYPLTPENLNNYAGIIAPAVGDDSDDGYSIGSVWIDTVAEDAYICISPAVGAAVWKKTTP